ncbi:protein NRDE2 homolog [Elysia marginata]|uniref:Protein NRDE2 homolog n=1 Tax=Elysia marginata TaxID=1093978 RepID=A0AAV4JXA4_9GAST|nr:protein NRDE2 homolog [Elysia marginata]
MVFKDRGQREKGYDHRMKYEVRQRKDFRRIQKAVQQPQQAEPVEGKNNLETLRLTLPPSAMNAILAAQNEQPQVYESDSPLSFRHASGQSHSRSPEKYSTEQTSEEDAEVQTDERKHPVKRKKKKHKHKHKHKKLKRHQRSDSPDCLPDMKYAKVPVGAVFLDDIDGLKPEHAFHIDREKNKDLLRYQSVSTRHIARYKSFFRSCLGASHLMLDKKESSKNKKGLDFARYFGKIGMRQICSKGTALEIERTNQMSDLDFVPLPKLSKQSLSQNESESLSYSCLDEATSLYVHGKGIDHKSHADLTVTAEQDFIMDEIFEKVRSFNQRTQDEPQNVALWLEFVAFQDIVAQREKVGAGGLSQTASLGELYRPTKSVIDKKLAILDKALESNPSSLELKLARLELYQDVWETEKLEKAWEALLFVHAGKVDLWQEYLARQQGSSLQGFSVSRAVKRYHKCFKTLTAIMDGQVKVIHEDSHMEEKMIGLFSQYCNFLHLSGYTERAVATFQALIEFNLHCPSSLNLSSTVDRAGQFEQFWDSSVPRFGEEGARGWAKWAEQKSKGDEQQVSFVDVSLEEQEDAIILEQLPRSETWVKMEKLRGSSHFLPWRPDTSKGETEDSAEDPERLVLSEDICPTLFRLTKSESCVRIICLFLKFLGLSSASLNERIQFWNQETGGLKFEQYAEISVSNYLQFSDCSLAKNLGTVSAVSPFNQHLLVVVNNILRQAESYFSLSNRTFFTLLRLDVEILKHGAKTVSEIPSAGIKAVKKFGKSLLKESQNRNNLILWNAYIRLLWVCSDNIAETVSMVETAMAMFMGPHNSSDPEKKYGVSCLCLTYCQILLNFEPLEHIESSLRCSSPSQDDRQQAMCCLSALMENKVYKPGLSTEISPAYILKIRSLFQRCITDVSRKSNLMRSNSCEFFCVLTDCSALFEFCSSNLTSANAVYESARLNILKLEQNDSDLHGICSIIRKNMYLHQLSFITNVMHIAIIPLATVREVINNGLNQFPNSSKLHTAFIKLEERSHIAGRLRQFYNSALRNATSLTVPFFAVISEVLRHEKINAANSSLQSIAASSSECNDTGIVHRLRSLFETVLGLSVSSHSPLFWRLYLNFEFKFGTVSKAKGILYRALQSCPWAKCIFIDGISLFGDIELQEMMDLMTEEEIRLRVPLEEVDLLRTAEKVESDNENTVKEEPGSENEIDESEYKETA